MPAVVDSLTRSSARNQAGSETWRFSLVGVPHRCIPGESFNMFDKRSSFLDRLTQPGPKHNVRSKRMGLLDEGKKYPITGSTRSPQPNNLARTRLANQLFSRRYRPGSLVLLPEIAAEYQMDVDY